MFVGLWCCRREIRRRRAMSVGLGMLMATAFKDAPERLDPPN